MHWMQTDSEVLLFINKNYDLGQSAYIVTFKNLQHNFFCD